MQFYDVDEELIDSFRYIYMWFTISYSDEIAIFKAKDSRSISTAKALIETRDAKNARISVRELCEGYKRIKLH